MGPASIEETRRTELMNHLLRDEGPDSNYVRYVRTVFSSPRLTIYEPPPPTPPAPSQPGSRKKINPYLTERFGLLTDTSFERCRMFYGDHANTMDIAYRTFGVPKEIICGILRIETNFGLPTALTPHPLGRRPAVNSLYTLYVRRSTIKRREFAARELKFFLRIAYNLGWDVFEIPGSPTGAFGLPQFEPSSFNVAKDGNGDGKVDLFNPDDAIMSVAHYLVTRGWDKNPKHQNLAIAKYYGLGDKERYYMKAVLKYAEGMKKYFDAHPITNEPIPNKPIP
jgi:membrane-bound lytic murein transglycosylase B